MVSILSTFNSSYGLIFYLFFLSLFSCSHSKRFESGINAIKKKKEIARPTTLIPLKTGPSGAPSPYFVNKSKEWGLEGLSSVHNYAVDWNGDGYTDLVLLPSYFSVPNFLVYDPKQKKFIPSSYNPITDSSRASYLVFHDFNKDGYLDLILGTLNQKTELAKSPLRLFLAHKNKTGQIIFKEREKAFPNLKMPTSSISLIDYNMDGAIDLFIGNWFDHSKTRSPPSPDRLFINQQLVFKDASYLLEGELDYSKSLASYINARPTFGTSICDIDQNGYPDILSASSGGYGNRLWLNLKDKKNKDRIFKDYGRPSNVAADKEGAYDRLSGGNSFYAICNDYNNDGLIDLAMGELFHSYDAESQDRSSILTGTRFDFPPQFLRTEYHKDDGSGAWSQGDRRAIWFDYNFDGLLDLMVENSGFPPKSRLILFYQEDDHSFSDLAQDFGIDILNPAGIIIMDVDRDGRLDFIFGQTALRDSRIKPKLFAYHNLIPREGRRQLKFSLNGKESNASGLGATLILKSNMRTSRRNVEYTYGSLPSQNEEGLLFGLEKDERPEWIEVRWPLLKKGKSGRQYPLIKRYSLKNLKFKYHMKIELQENGRLQVL
jgi:enediyne biosynthesis protein E4